MRPGRYEPPVSLITVSSNSACPNYNLTSLVCQIRVRLPRLPAPQEAALGEAPIPAP